MTALPKETTAQLLSTAEVAGMMGVETDWIEWIQHYRSERGIDWIYQGINRLETYWTPSGIEKLMLALCNRHFPRLEWEKQDGTCWDSVMDCQESWLRLRLHQHSLCWKAELSAHKAVYAQNMPGVCKISLFEHKAPTPNAALSALADAWKPAWEAMRPTGGD